VKLVKGTPPDIDTGEFHCGTPVEAAIPHPVRQRDKAARSFGRFSNIPATCPPASDPGARPLRNDLHRARLPNCVANSKPNQHTVSPSRSSHGSPRRVQTTARHRLFSPARQVVFVITPEAVNSRRLGMNRNVRLSGLRRTGVLRQRLAGSLVLRSTSSTRRAIAPAVKRTRPAARKRIVAQLSGPPPGLFLAAPMCKIQPVCEISVSECGSAFNPAARRSMISNGVR
jgi:hypothetical protein